MKRVVNSSREHRNIIRTACAAITVAAGLAIALPGFAAPALIQGAPTTLEGNSVEMVSLRHQQHMWQTSDEATHVLINQGSLGQQYHSLKLFSSFDSGETWVPEFSLPGSMRNSTADGLLTGDQLRLVYDSARGGIVYAEFHYDSTLKSWSLVGTKTVFESEQSLAINPAIAVDSQGTVWCTFVDVDDASGEQEIKLVYRVDGASGWQDTGLVFGPAGTSEKRSARPTAIPNGVGIIFTVDANTYWAYRLNDWPASQPWTQETLFTSPPPYDKDPFESHFSVARDGHGDLHLAIADHGRLLYFHYRSDAQAWDPGRVLSGDIKAAYPQVTLEDGTLSLFVNDLGRIRVYQSTDGGTTFTLPYVLTHTPATPGSGIGYANPRIETPSHAHGSIPVLQQYTDGVIQKALYFQVPDVPVTH